MTAQAKFKFPGTDLPIQFVGRAPKALKSRAGKAKVNGSLPFVTSAKKADAPFWDVPLSGGYLGGYETGEAMAIAFLKELREHGQHQFSKTLLTSIVQSFMFRFEQEGGISMDDRSKRDEDWSPSYAALRGQCCGFFHKLQEWLIGSAQHLGAGLDCVTEQELLRRANAGLGFNADAHWASLENEEEEPAPRRRRAKRGAE